MVKSYKNRVNLFYMLFGSFPFSPRNIIEQDTHSFLEETKEIYIPLKICIQNPLNWIKKGGWGKGIVELNYKLQRDKRGKRGRKKVEKKKQIDILKKSRRSLFCPSSSTFFYKYEMCIYTKVFTCW